MGEEDCQNRPNHAKDQRQKMKPKEAARIFDQLEMDVLLQVIDRMKSTKTAPVLAAMLPARAKELTMRIAERRKVSVSN